VDWGTWFLEGSDTPRICTSQDIDTQYFQFQTFQQDLPLHVSHDIYTFVVCVTHRDRYFVISCLHKFS
jgi:hypothetical protein